MSGLAEEARAADPDRFLCALFMPPAQRDAAMALVLLNHELARIPELVSKPLPGLIRCQWWREALEATAAGRPPDHPVLRALAPPLTAGRLDPAELLSLVEAREPDLEGWAPETLDELEAHAAATAGTLQAATARLLGADAATLTRARNAGTAFGLVGAVRAVDAQARRGRVLLPRDRLAGAGITAADVLAGRMSLGLGDVVRAIIGRAEALLAASRPPDRATLPAVLAGAYARRLRRLGHDPFRAADLTRPPTLPLRLWWAARRGL
jgi:phytoene synthase